MPSNSPVPVPSMITSLPSSGMRLGGQVTFRTHCDLSATTWAIVEKPPLRPFNVPQKLAVFVWNAFFSVTSSLAIVCRDTLVPASDPVNEFTEYRDKMTRQRSGCAEEQSSPTVCWPTFALGTLVNVPLAVISALSTVLV